MKVGECLRVPYVVSAWSQQLPDGEWVRHVEHSELPDCGADAPSIGEALARLENRRVAVVLDLLAQGRRLPIRRGMLGDAAARSRLRRHGLFGQVAPLWDLEVDEFAASSGAAARDETSREPVEGGRSGCL